MAKDRSNQGFMSHSFLVTEDDGDTEVVEVDNCFQQPWFSDKADDDEQTVVDGMNFEALEESVVAQLSTSEPLSENPFPEETEVVLFVGAFEKDARHCLVSLKSSSPDDQQRHLASRLCSLHGVAKVSPEGGSSAAFQWPWTYLATEYLMVAPLILRKEELVQAMGQHRDSSLMQAQISPLSRMDDALQAKIKSLPKFVLVNNRSMPVSM
jgi:hypothetical protein